jgi:S-adenosylhomocysteine hydrolase
MRVRVLRETEQLDILNIVRRIVISSEEQYRRSAVSSQSSTLRERILTDETLQFWGDLIAAEKNCALSPSRLRSLLGDASSNLMAALDANLEALPSDDPNAMSMIDDYVIRRYCDISPKAIAPIINTYHIPDSLPLLDEVVERSNVQGQPFANAIVLSSMHILGSIVPLYVWLHRLGVDYQDIYLLGKPYSTSRPVSLLLRRKGVHVHPASSRLPPAAIQDPQSYESLRSAAARELLERVSRKLDAAGVSRRLLVLDDGGTITQALQEMEPGDLTERTVAVEQTTSGIRHINARPLLFPVVNVADSYTKHTKESPWIARSVFEETSTRLKRLGRANPPARVLIMGFGPIGAVVAGVFKNNGADVTVCEPDGKKSGAIEEGHFHRTHPKKLDRALASAELVIGCTGERSLPDRNLGSIREGAIFASASSSNTEFSGLVAKQVDCFKWAWAAHFEQDSDFQRCHSDFLIQPNRQGDTTRAWLLNGGFPVNFSGAVDPIRPEIIQLTRALMLIGAITAMQFVGEKKEIGVNGEATDYLNERFSDVESQVTWKTLSTPS